LRWSCTSCERWGFGWRYLAGFPLKTLISELGHESQATTQRYLADVRGPAEAKKAVAKLLSFLSRRS